VLTSLSISGTLPSELGKLEKLKYLGLNGNRISGTIPESYSNFDPECWTTDNYWDCYQSSGETANNLFLDFRQLELEPGPLPRGWGTDCWLGRMSGVAGTCLGIPPDSCSAYGPNAKMNYFELNTCTVCNSSDAWVAFLLFVSVVGSAGGFYLYLRLLEKYPHYQGWIASVGIVMGELQVAAAMGALLSLDNSIVRSITQLGALSFFDLSVVQPACLFPAADPEDGAGQNPMLTVYIPGVQVAVPLLVALCFAIQKLCIKRCCNDGTRCCLPADEELEGVAVYSNPAKCNCSRCKVDKVENRLVVFFAQISPLMGKLALTGLRFGGSGWYLGAFILTGLLAFPLKLLFHVRSSLLGKQDCPQGRCVMFGRVRGLIRLQYVVAKFRVGTPYWQFVLWARQAVLQATDAFIFDDAISQACVLLLQLVIFLGLQRHWRPYVMPEQNRVEETLLATNIIIVGLSLAFYAAGRSLGALAIDALMVLLLLGVPIYFIVRADTIRRWLYRFKSDALASEGTVTVDPPTRENVESGGVAMGPLGGREGGGAVRASVGHAQPLGNAKALPVARVLSTTPAATVPVAVLAATPVGNRNDDRVSRCGQEHDRRGTMISSQL
jgi:hypothetical protein